MLKQVSFQLPHIELKGLRGGTPGRPFLLLLHGWLDNAHSFLPMAPYLEPFDWVAVDFPGHGLSQHRPLGCAYYFADWVADIEALIRSQGWTDVNLVGHSMGGYVAQVLAAVSPELVQKLLTIEAFGMVISPAEDSLQQLRKGLRARYKATKRRDPVYPDMEALVRARAEVSGFEEPLARLLLERNLEPVDGGFRWRTDPRVRAPSPFRYCAAQVPALLRGIEAPMHVVVGKDGHQELAQALQVWRTDVRQLTVEELSGGHHLHMEHPSAIGAVLARQFKEQV